VEKATAEKSANENNTAGTVSIRSAFVGIANSIIQSEAVNRSTRRNNSAPNRGKEPILNTPPKSLESNPSIKTPNASPKTPGSIIKIKKSDPEPTVSTSRARNQTQFFNPSDYEKGKETRTSRSIQNVKGTGKDIFYEKEGYKKALLSNMFDLKSLGTQTTGKFRKEEQTAEGRGRRLMMTSLLPVKKLCQGTFQALPYPVETVRLQCTPPRNYNSNKQQNELSESEEASFGGYQVFFELEFPPAVQGRS